MSSECLCVRCEFKTQIPFFEEGRRRRRRFESKSPSFISSLSLSLFSSSTKSYPRFSSREFGFLTPIKQKFPPCARISKKFSRRFISSIIPAAFSRSDLFHLESLSLFFSFFLSPLEEMILENHISQKKILYRERLPGARPWS